MATPTLGGTPTTIDAADATTDWTGTSVATATDIQKDGTSIECIRRTDLSTIQWDHPSSSVNVSNQHIRVWDNFAAIANLDTETNNGMEFYAGDGTNTAYWVAYGSDTYTGGWKNYVIDIESTPASGSVNTAAVTLMGMRFNRTSAPANKVNSWIDYLRYGDGYYATGGTSGDEIDLAGINTQDVTNAYGIVTESEGIYFCWGALTIGNGATTTWFEMIGEVLVFPDADVSTTLYKIVGAGSGCRVNIEDSVIQASTGKSAIIDMDDTNLVSMTLKNSFLTRSGEIRLKSGQIFTGNTCNDCGQILAAGADCRNTTVKNYEGTANTSALVWTPATDPDGLLDGMTFEMGATLTHAIEFGTSSPLTMTLTNVTFTGYGTSNNTNNSDLHIKRTTGTVTINISGSGGTAPAGITHRSDGATVVIQATVTIKMTIKDESGTVIENARGAIYATETVGGVTVGDELIDGAGGDLSNASGIVQNTGFSFPGDLNCEIRVRKSSAATKYIPYKAPALITADGLDVIVTLTEDTIIA